MRLYITFLFYFSVATLEFSKFPCLKPFSLQKQNETSGRIELYKKKHKSVEVDK